MTGQILTVLSYGIYYFSRFLKEKKNIMLYDNVSKAVTILSFIFLKSYDGIATTIFTLVRNITGRAVINKKLKVKIISFIILLAVMVGMYSVKFAGIGTIAVGISMLFNLVGVIFLGPQGMRICTSCGSVFYIIFQLSIKNTAGGICEFVTLIVNLVSFIKYKKTDK